MPKIYTERHKRSGHLGERGDGRVGRGLFLFWGIVGKSLPRDAGINTEARGRARGFSLLLKIQIQGEELKVRGGMCPVLLDFSLF